ncbi:hypothetical protein [Candidatus Nitrospira bockiana]
MLQAFLARPGSLSFPSNLAYGQDLAAAGGRAVRLPTGHLLYYGRHGRRILATDPDGNPLHECEWETEGGSIHLRRARLYLDWGRWVGVRSGGLVNTTVLDLSRKPGWQRLKADDLRGMAAQALHVPMEEVRFFYGDEDLVIDSRGRATIRHKKDAFYVLEDGTFDRATFMACMGAMHWSRIDFLPVVELFQSLLPGTGSAAFELIRGLYDDQNAGREPLPLRYRGIPTYPSEAAYRLFSSFFVPSAPGGQSPFPVFMDPTRSHEVTWLPSPQPPRRYLDAGRRLCVTIQGETALKATLADDPTGLSYTNVERAAFPPCGRALGVRGPSLILKDGDRVAELPLSPAWGSLRDVSTLPRTAFPPGGTEPVLEWRTLFRDGPPAVTPAEAFSAVLLYPEDDTEIDEAASQPFVTDYLEDLFEEHPDLAQRVRQARDVLVDNLDAGLRACIDLSRPAAVTVLYTRPGLAQKQAQALWNDAAGRQRLPDLRRITLLPAAPAPAERGPTYDLVYRWLPFADFTRPAHLEDRVRELAGVLRPGGLAFLVGPESIKSSFGPAGLHVLTASPVSALPTFQMHRTILPQARLRVGLTLFQVAKPRAAST